MAGKLAAQAAAEAAAEVAADSALDQELQVVDVRSGTRIGLPIFKDSIVVYLGASRNKSVPLIGRVLVDKVEDETGELDANGQPVLSVTVLKSAIDDGAVTCYDFTSHDSKGALIRQRMYRQSKPAEARNKPFLIVEHPEHLRQFMRMLNAENRREFITLIAHGQAPAFEDWVRRKEAKLAEHAAEVAATAE